MDEETVMLNVRPDKKFEPDEIKGIIRDIVHKNLDGKIYDHVFASDWIKLLTREIHDKVKDFITKNYKFAVQVIIGGIREQGLKAIGGCIWNEDTDAAAIVLFTGETLYCVVAVFVVYCICYDL